MLENICLASFCFVFFLVFLLFAAVRFAFHWKSEKKNTTEADAIDQHATRGDRLDFKTMERRGFDFKARSQARSLGPVRWGISVTLMRTFDKDVAAEAYAEDAVDVVA